MQSEAELLMKAPEWYPLIESSMEITKEPESEENDEYQCVSDSFKVNAKLDAFLDPDSNTDNPTQKETP